MTVTIAYMGIPGSNSEQAATEFAAKMGWDEYELLPRVDSRGVVDAMDLEGAEYGVVAVANINAGPVEETRAALEGRPIPELPPLSERCDTAVRQFELAAANKGEKIACLEARKQYAWYLKGVPHAGYYKEQIVKITTLEDVYRITAGIKRDLC